MKTQSKMVKQYNNFLILSASPVTTTRSLQIFILYDPLLQHHWKGYNETQSERLHLRRCLSFVYICAVNIQLKMNSSMDDLHEPRSQIQGNLKTSASRRAQQ